MTFRESLRASGLPSSDATLLGGGAGIYIYEMTKMKKCRLKQTLVTGISNILKVLSRIFRTNKLTLSNLKSIHLLLRLFAVLVCCFLIHSIFSEPY